MMDRRESANLDRFLTTPPEPVYACEVCGEEMPEDLDSAVCVDCTGLVAVARDAIDALRKANALLDDIDARLSRGDTTPHVLNALRKARS